MRGRKPAPTVLKVLRGNPGKRRLNRAEPQPPALEPDVPPELVEAEARVEWLRTIAPAIATGQITAADRALAIAHCDLWATWQSQLGEARRHAHIIAVGPNQYPTPNPARMMANKTYQLLRATAADLGLSPTSRARVAVPGRDGSSADEDRFFKRHADTAADIRRITP